MRPTRISNRCARSSQRARLLFNSVGEEEIATRDLRPGRARQEPRDRPCRRTGPAAAGADLDRRIRAAPLALRALPGPPRRFEEHRLPHRGVPHVSRAPGRDVAAARAGRTAQRDAHCGDGILDLGAVSEPAKAALLTYARALAQPSIHESFSRAIYEAWYARRPVLVHGECRATARAVEDAGGGWIGSTLEEWVRMFAAVDESADDAVDALGERGWAAALDNGAGTSSRAARSMPSARASRRRPARASRTSFPSATRPSRATRNRSPTRSTPPEPNPPSRLPGTAVPALPPTRSRTSHRHLTAAARTPATSHPIAAEIIVAHDGAVVIPSGAVQAPFRPRRHLRPVARHSRAARRVRHHRASTTAGRIAGPMGGPAPAARTLARRQGHAPLHRAARRRRSPPSARYVRRLPRPRARRAPARLHRRLRYAAPKHAAARAGGTRPAQRGRAGPRCDGRALRRLSRGDGRIGRRAPAAGRERRHAVVVRPADRRTRRRHRDGNDRGVRSRRATRSTRGVSPRSYVSSLPIARCGRRSSAKAVACAHAMHPARWPPPCWKRWPATRS